MAAGGAGLAAMLLGLRASGSASWPSAASLLGVFETSIAKMRVFRVPELPRRRAMLGLLGVLLLFVSRGMCL